MCAGGGGNTVVCCQERCRNKLVLTTVIYFLKGKCLDLH